MRKAHTGRQDGHTRRWDGEKEGEREEGEGDMDRWKEREVGVRSLGVRESQGGFWRRIPTPKYTDTPERQRDLYIPPENLNQFWNSRCAPPSPRGSTKEDRSGLSALLGRLQPRIQGLPVVTGTMSWGGLSCVSDWRSCCDLHILPPISWHQLPLLFWLFNFFFSLNNEFSWFQCRWWGELQIVELL